MRTITIRIDEHTKFGKQFLSLLKFFAAEKKGVAVVKDEKGLAQSGIEAAFEDVKLGRLTTYKNSDDLFEKVLR
ncbi:hypothetical protein FW774_03435 (plasmid) [Pedobacter sp. BS3]|uniref:hypothetical protein n=1 Tax=Pedobacter sp. BS3 TaxID=2567937 RepID=UPI0011F03E47|nr:hypothetical protein [Pedobacter sp. BS3]TZF86117.1 hypothetical protein FW774_03435 [Pedobacter sp. BS3]